MTDLLRQCWTGLRALLVLTAVCGIAYPVLIWGIGQTAFGHQANGSVISQHGVVVGSTLLGQNFTGNRWFLPRPSANDYDGLASGGSNLGPSNPKLIGQLNERRAAVAAREHVPPAQVPADAVTASASGLDPYISPAYAQLQVPRVAAARGLSLTRVRALVQANTSGRTLGFLGEPRVNVFELDLALSRS